MLTAGLIVAAGRGSRLGGELPKQYQPLGSHPVLRHAVAALLAHPAIGALQIVIHPDDRDLCAEALAGLADPRILPPVAGADTRSGSVLAGLKALAPYAPDAVLIHDAARPFLTPDLITAVLAALDDAPASLPALPIVDALWRAGIGTAIEPVRGPAPAGAGGLPGRGLRHRAPRGGRPARPWPRLPRHHLRVGRAL
jgi:2-C-methyl-D-erythritol 4-phosphate cytidylyltransferase/2-C-methyl-D-erythritol 2,4-cyclodiphosphate synthase